MNKFGFIDFFKYVFYYKLVKLASKKQTASNYQYNKPKNTQPHCIKADKRLTATNFLL